MRLSRLLLAVGALSALAASAHAVEPFVGRWAISPQVCSGNGNSARTAALVATDTTLWWYAGFCRIGKMYKLGYAVYVQAHCGSAGDVPVTLDARGDRMRVSWNRGKYEELRRCK